MEQPAISKSEAQLALDEINSALDRTRKAIACGPAAPILMLWGLIWIIGYSITHFAPEQAGVAWMILVFTGALSSWWAGVKLQSPVKSPNDAKIGLFWLVLFAYAIAWLFLLAPDGLPRGQEWATQHPFTEKQIGAFFATVPMFAYVVGGLWLSRFFVWLGLFVTLLTFLGYYLLHDYFNLWMAFTGGGSLFVAGLYMRRNWR